MMEGGGGSTGHKDRVLGFVLGALVGDAAAQPLHWIYDEQKLAAATQGIESTPEFATPSRNPFYSIPTGSFTCYGDQLYVVLESLAETGGKLDTRDLADRLNKHFGKGSTYDIPDRKNTPISGGWRTHSMTHFCESYEEGKRPPQSMGDPADEQSDGLIRLIPLVAVYAGKEDMLDKAEEVIALTQTNELAVATGLAVARIYEKYLLSPAGTPVDVEKILHELIETLSDPHHKKPHASDPLIVEFIQQALKARKDGVSYHDFQKQMGLSCALKFNLPGCFHLLLSLPPLSPSSELAGETYVRTIRTLLFRGGDSASRANIIGGLLGAQAGLSHLPHAWTEKTTNFARAKGLAEKLAAAL